MILLDFIFQLMAGVMTMLMAINMVRKGVKKSLWGVIAMCWLPSMAPFGRLS